MERARPPARADCEHFRLQVLQHASTRVAAGPVPPRPTRAQLRGDGSVRALVDGPCLQAAARPRGRDGDATRDLYAATRARNPQPNGGASVRSILAAKVALSVLLGLVAGMTVPGVVASNFGSNLNHPCDTTTASQCVANNGVHSVWFGLPAGSAMRSPTLFAMDVYDGVADVSTSEDVSCCGSNADAWVVEADLGNTGWWAYGSCWTTATYGGTDPDRWCRPQRIYYNIGHPANWDGTLSGRRTVACHELGHTLGLRHSISTQNSCMRNAVTNQTDITTHDHAVLNGQY